MDRSTFESADLVVDEIADKLDELLDSDHFAAIRVLLARLMRYIALSKAGIRVFALGFPFQWRLDRHSRSRYSCVHVYLELPRCPLRRPGSSMCQLHPGIIAFLDVCAAPFVRGRLGLGGQ